MDERHLEPVPDLKEQHGILIPMVVRMDLLANPAIIREHISWMQENDFERWNQINAIANSLSRGDMAIKEGIFAGFVVDELIHDKEKTFSLDDEIGEVIPFPDPEKRKKNWKFWERRTGIGAVAGVLTLGLFYKRSNRNDFKPFDDAA